MAAQLSPQARWRWQVAVRMLAAVAGGYGLAALASSVLALLAQASGMAPADAVIGATLISFAVHAGVALYAFGAATAARAWVLPALAALLLWPVLLWLG